MFAIFKLAFCISVFRSSINMYDHTPITNHHCS